MTRFGWRLTELIAGLLDPKEREAVLGDIAESDESFWHAAFAVLNLASRRQMSSWKRWRPWLALLCVAGVGGAVMIPVIGSLDMGLSLQIRTWWRYRVPYETGQTVGKEVLWFSGLFLALLAGSWLIGMAAAWASPRTAWLTSMVLFLIVAVCLRAPLTVELPLLLLQAALFLSFVIPAIFGTRLVLRRRAKEINR